VSLSNTLRNLSSILSSVSTVYAASAAEVGDAAAVVESNYSDQTLLHQTRWGEMIIQPQIVGLWWTSVCDALCICGGRGMFEMYSPWIQDGGGRKKTNGEIAITQPRIVLLVRWCITASRRLRRCWTCRLVHYEIRIKSPERLARRRSAFKLQCIAIVVYTAEWRSGRAAKLRAFHIRRAAGLTRTMNSEDCSVCGLWLIDSLIDWLTDWLTDWLIDWLINWLIDWLIEWMSEWLIDWLIDWLIEWMSKWMNERTNEWIQTQVPFAQFVGLRSCC